MDLTFAPVTKAHEKLVRAWLDKPYIREWFYGEGLQVTLKHLEQCAQGESDLFQCWLAFSEGKPFAYLMTSAVAFPDDDLHKWCTTQGPAITLDLLIGEEEYLGKGIAAPMICAFIDTQFPTAREVLIDPEAANVRAIHAYEKAGFQKLGDFIPESGSMRGIPHMMLHLVR